MTLTLVPMSEFCLAIVPPLAPVTKPSVAPAEELGYTPFPQFTSVRSLALAPTEDVAAEPPADVAEPYSYPSDADQDTKYNDAVRKLSDPWPKNATDWAFSPSDDFVTAAAAALGGLIWFANEAWNVTEGTVSTGLNMMAISISPLQQYIIDESDKFGTGEGAFGFRL